MVSRDLSTSPLELPFHFIVLPGNESSLIRECLERRGYWRSMDTETAAMHAAYQEKRNKSSSSTSTSSRPPPASTTTNSTKPIRFNYLWAGNGQRFAWTSLVKDGSCRQLVAKIPNNVEICRKSNLAVNLANSSSAEKPLDFFPYSIVLQAKSSSPSAWKDFAATFKSYAARNEKIWIVKPGALNRGNGIEVFDSFEAIKSFIDHKSIGSSWVVQKYLEAPLLIEGRKFDLRAYALVAPDGHVYMHREAYVRTSSATFDKTNLSNRAMHLTNDAIQCKTNAYGQHEDANKLNLDEMQEKLGSRYQVRGTFMPRMRDICRETFQRLGHLLNPQRIEYCCELFGLDFMMDVEGKVYLIEINSSPALLRHGRVLTELLPRVVEEMVQKTVDVVFPPPPSASRMELLDGFEALGVVIGDGKGTSK